MAKAAQEVHVDVDGFRRDGWTLIRGALTPADVARLAGLIDDHRFAHADDAVPDTADGTEKEGGKDGYGDPNSDVSRDFFATVPGVAEWHREVGLHKVAGALLGVEETEAVRDRLFVKAPGEGERTMWHQDAPFTPEATGELVVLWIPLSIDGADAAPLLLACGSHHGPPMIESGLAWWRTVIGTETGVVEEADIAGLYRVEEAVASVGDVVALHGKVLHASKPNRSLSERVAYSVRLTPAQT